jgi:hypothetical protein
MSWGPWSVGCKGYDERKAQLRSLAAIVHLQLGPRHPLIDALHHAELDGMKFVEAFDEVERLPALHRRRLIATFCAITFRTPRRP